MQEILQGDCVEVMRGMDTASVDMVLTSPPYDNLRTYNGYTFDFESTAREIQRVLKPGGVCVWVVGDATVKGSETGTSFRQALFFKEIGMNLHDTMIYQKANYVPLTHNRYEQSFEYIFILSKGKPNTFNPVMIPTKNAGKVEKYGLERRKNHGTNHAMRLYDKTTFKTTKETKIAPNIFSYTLGSERPKHPAPFPTCLAKDHILSWSNEGDTVLDPFLGSGTTLLATQELNRNGIGIEISEEYCKIAEARIKAVQ